MSAITNVDVQQELLKQAKTVTEARAIQMRIIEEMNRLEGIRFAASNPALAAQIRPIAQQFTPAEIAVASQGVRGI